MYKVLGLLVSVTNPYNIDVEIVYNRITVIEGLTVTLQILSREMLIGNQLLSISSHITGLEVTYW